MNQGSRAHTRVGRCILPLLLVAACLGAAAPAQAAPVFGIDTSAVEKWFRDPDHASRVAGLIHQAGGDGARVGISWRGVQRKGPSFWNWKRWDTEVAALQEEGIRPLLMLHGSPGWAIGNFSCSTKHCPPHPKHYDQWATFAAAAAARYSNAVAVEIWNAPNTKAWWSLPGGSDPKHYAEVFGAAAAAIHEAAPTMPVLFGSTGGAQFRDRNGTLSIPTFYAGFYANVDRSVLEPQDAMAIHAYPQQDELNTLDGRFARVWTEARTAIADGADLGRKIWQTELGVTTTGPWKVTEPEQRNGLLNAIDFLKTQPDVGGIFVFTLIENSTSTTNYEAGYGLMHHPDRETLVPKPAYCALEARAAVPGTVQGC